MKKFSNFEGNVISKSEMKDVNGGRTCHANTVNGQVRDYNYGGCNGASNCYEYTCPRVVAYGW